MAQEASSRKEAEAYFSAYVRREEEWDGRSRCPRGEEGSGRHLDGRFCASKFYNIASIQI